MPAKRSISVGIVDEISSQLDVIHGFITGFAPADIVLLREALEDLVQAVHCGMFSSSSRAAALDWAADAAPARRFSLRADNQHPSLLRVVGNVLRERLAITAGPGIELRLVGRGRSSGLPKTRLQGQLPAAIPYIDEQQLVPLRWDREQLDSPCDCVVRVHFPEDLGDPAFRRYAAACLLWDRLLASGAYLEPNGVGPPFVQNDLELFMVSPKTIEHIVIYLCQSSSCFIGLCMAFGHLSTTVAALRLIEVERMS